MGNRSKWAQQLDKQRAKESAAVHARRAPKIEKAKAGKQPKPSKSPMSDLIKDAGGATFI